MAVGTAVSFAIQAILMLWILDRRIGGLDLRRTAMPIAKMLAAALLMGAACVGVQRLAIYPRGEGKVVWLCQLVVLMGTGVVVYLGMCWGMGVGVLRQVVRGGV